ncbi:protein SpaM [Pseudomonas vanderleydeniana]|uniref:Protein SpaM n=1 Tax=Pseudomonas vanderleydeniana TaxID=2745495 RepID=A0A9E6PIB8_9PSED|nr:protein SpaM [Pseudomonas vanderleydeniana]QXI27111.1 protein SpaM [Pseudomonas vanderleydeniana]
MNSLADIERLLRFGNWRLRRVETTLLCLRQRRVQLLHELSALDEQEASLRALLDSHRAEDRVFDHGQLLGMLRRQAVIRRQIQQMALERQPLTEQRAELDQQVRQRQQELERLQRKQSKYTAVRQRLGRELRLQRLRRDEGEVDERMGVTR